MDPLTKMALVGTARQSEPDDDAGGVAGGVLAALAALPVERRVLLAAGARAAAAMAGRRASRSEQAVAAAPPETRRVCSVKAARIVGDLLGGHHPELLAEAFALLARAGQHLPPALLPDALRVRGDELRDAVRPVLGERGAWLARLHDGWAWAAGPAAAASLDELSRAWNDGAPAARREILARARTIDTARARAWLEATWASEKADERAALLGVLRTGISPADEPFLEAQLRDRASAVREAAQALLPHLPESAFVQRMTARADAMLDYKRSMLAFAGKRGTLTASPPEKVDEAAERDGLGKPPQGVGARAFWLSRTLAAVPVARWTARFEATPAQLVAAAAATDWASALCEGWTRAAVVSGDAEWLGALWEFFVHSDERSVTPLIAGAMALAALQKMSSADACSRVEALFGDARARVHVAMALHALPKPWSAHLGAAWLRAARAELRGSSSPGGMLASAGDAALAIPEECFALALEPFEIAEGQRAVERALSDFAEIIRIRNDLAQEIAP